MGKRELPGIKCKGVVVKKTDSHGSGSMFMKNAILYAILFIITSTLRLSAQDEKIDKVSQLVSAENFFAALVKEKGIKKGFLAVSDANTIIFRPEPVSAEKYFKNKHDDAGLLSWEPTYAKISKSGDWGYTTGPYTYMETDSSEPVYYGEYLSVWKKNQNDVWKLAIDVGIPHPKPSAISKMIFSNPQNEKFQPQYSDVRLKEREALVLTTDELFATSLNGDNTLARNSFLANDSQLLFPGYEPVTGKTQVLNFWESHHIRLTSQPIKADRAFSGELAFTYGDANIEQKGQNKLYHYVRIWELQSGYQWNIIIEVYVEGSQI
jgi:ketosteroid isomerase-like protein